MNKYLHFNLHNNVPKGVLNQLLDEHRAVEKLGWSDRWFLKLFNGVPLEEGFSESIYPVGYGMDRHLVNYVRLRQAGFEWLRRNAGKYNATLLRYCSGDIFQYINVGKFGPYFTVHHTMEVEEGASRPHVLGIIERNLEKYFSGSVLDGATGIVGVTPEIVEYELKRLGERKPSYCHPNGICLDSSTVLSDARSGVLKLLFVASQVSPWHGLDLLLDNLNISDQKFELHIVGNMTVDKTTLDDRFIFHGSRSRSYINTLVSKCDLGLSSFAMGKLNMKQACTLKVREYLASGLPVYSGYQDAGLPDDFPFYCQGRPLADRILGYADKCRQFSRSSIRKASEPYIDKVALMQKLIRWLDEVMV